MCVVLDMNVSSLHQYFRLLQCLSVAVCYVSYSVGYILNVTKEVDNFFLGTFEYMNVRYGLLLIVFACFSVAFFLTLFLQCITWYVCWSLRVYDLKEADLLRHWGKTYRFLHKAK